jgi:hypothetical protein
LLAKPVVFLLNLGEAAGEFVILFAFKLRPLVLIALRMLDQILSSPAGLRLYFRDTASYKEN